MNLKVLKIGGSVITDKRRGVFEHLREKRLNEVCRAVADANDGKLILVHGVGSFGHPYVEKYGLENPAGISKTHLGCLKLTTILCRKLAEMDVAALPLSPLPFLSKENISERLRFLLDLLDDGYLPVLHGDLVFESQGVKVISGDRVLMEICNSLPVTAAGFAIGAGGVTVNGRIAKTLTYDDFLKLKRSMESRKGSRKSDVTGGIIGKLENAFRIKEGCRVFIFKGDYGSVVKFLRGERVGTEVVR